MGIDGQDDDDDDWWLNAEASPAPAASDPPAAAAPEADADASPDDLGPYPTFILDDGWEALDRAVTADDHYNAIAGLVFHARHLTPQEHARLAELLRTPFRRPRGRPQNHALAEAGPGGKQLGPPPSPAGGAGGRARPHVLHLEGERPQGAARGGTAPRGTAQTVRRITGGFRSPGPLE